MKKHIISGLLLLAILLGGLSAFAKPADAYTRVGGYYRSNGTYVQPYYRTSPNSTRWDNFSTRGNYNPFTGRKGYTSPYRSYLRY